MEIVGKISIDELNILLDVINRSKDYEKFCMYMSLFYFTSNDKMEKVYKDWITYTNISLEKYIELVNLIDEKYLSKTIVKKKKNPVIDDEL